MEQIDDEFLDKRLAKVDLWLEEGRIPTSSKVIPIHESLKTQPWVLPTLSLQKDGQR